MTLVRFGNVVWTAASLGGAALLFACGGGSSGDAAPAPGAEAGIRGAGPNGSGLGSYPDVSAAVMRNVGNVAGTFSADGKLQNQSLWKDSSTFYAAVPPTTTRCSGTPVRSTGRPMDFPTTTWGATRATSRTPTPNT